MDVVVAEMLAREAPDLREHRIHVNYSPARDQRELLERAGAADIEQQVRGL